MNIGWGHGFCPEQIILDHETCKTAYGILQGLNFNKDDMGLDVIKHVEPHGHFLMEEHTVQHIRDFSLSPVLRQKKEDGSPRDPREVALEEFKRIDKTHHPEPLPKDILDKLDRILAAADQAAKEIP